MQLQDIVTSLLYPFEQLASLVPLPIFIFIGSFAEEIIAPLPSAVVTTVVGTQIQFAASPLLFLLFLSIIAGFAKTLAAAIYYLLADRVEDLITSKWGHLLGIKPGDLERLGTQFSHRIHDELLLFGLRAFPLAPTGIISLACGALKIPFRSFFLVTWAGYAVRNLIQLYLAYIGFEVVKTLISNEQMALPIQLFFLISGPLLLVGLGIFLKNSSKEPNP